MLISRKKHTSESGSLKNAMGRLIEGSLILPQALLALWAGTGVVPLDVYEEGDNLVIKASLPGIKPEDLNIEVCGNILTISGESRLETERKEENYFLSERHYGQFSRSVTLPYEVKVDEVNAEFEDGILTLTLPKAVTTQGKKYTVKLTTNVGESKAKAETPQAKAEKPEAKVEKKVAKSQVKPDKPGVNVEKPETKAETPEIKIEKPEPKAEKPAVKVEKPEVKAEKPVVNAEKLETKAETPRRRQRS
jgi:HSP20 family protein